MRSYDDRACELLSGSWSLILLVRFSQRERDLWWKGGGNFDLRYAPRECAHLQTCTLDIGVKRLWTLMAATVVIFLLLSTPTLASAALTNAAMLALPDGLMAQPDLALGTYPHYNTLPDGLMTTFFIRHS